LQWAQRVKDAYDEFAADRVVAEANQGGELVRAVLTQNAPNLPVTLVHATRDKRTRATPAAALWRRDWIDETRVMSPPPLDRIIVAVDPPVSVTGDECGILVVGSAGDQGYVLADRSAGGLTPLQWAARVKDAYDEYAADRVIAEANQGGELVRAVLTQNAPNLPVTLVHATRDKRTRATPAAALYEQRRIHHVGNFPDLEDQLCTWDQTMSSPDRLDALVWALHHLFPPIRKAEPHIRKL
ncbi:MAG: hypothetical protein JO348_03240, partial [Alphaproteobacteria bacterium]|nr:hypothetical protein [Alphaproteobacteria bacterium]